MNPQVKRLLAALLFAVGLTACTSSSATVSVGDDSAPTETTAPDELFDDPTPTTVDPQAIWEYEQFRWQDGVVDGYVMTYTQACGDYLRVDEPVTVWVDGVYFRSPVDSNVRPNNLATIPELHEVIVARGPDDTLEFAEGELGQPELITLDSPEVGRYFCFELINFAGSTKDGEGRMPVPLLFDAYTATTDASTFEVGVASCNGSPEVAYEENADSIIVEATSWTPDGDDRAGCGDLVTVELVEPVGDREIIDGFSGRIVPLLTDEILEQPKTLQQVDCEEDSPDCRAGFQIGTQLYAITCIGVADDGVSDVNVASGIIDGGSIDAFQIKSVGVNIMLAVNLSSGDCSNRAIGPIAGVEHAWSVATRVGNDQDQLSRFLCGLADLSDEQRAEERCDRFD